MFAQLSEAKSLRDIEALLASQAARRYHSGLREVHRSTLADAAARRPVSVFTGLLSVMMAGVARQYRRDLAGCVRLIDATTIRLNRLSEGWSRFSAHLCGVKAHVVYDPDADCPLYLGMTPARVNDITAAKVMPVEAGATYVFDLGYYDYGWWAKLDDAACRLVTRLKSNTPLALIEERPLPADPDIPSPDRIGFLPERMAASRHNPMSNAVREIRVRLETGKVLRIVTNDLDAPASEIADLYKRRWAIELFFHGGGANLGHPTPNVDRVAQEGAVFTSWYRKRVALPAAPSFMTGRIPIRSALSVVVCPATRTALPNPHRRSPSSSRRTAIARIGQRPG